MNGTSTERYELGERLGAGGMGSVYRAEDRESGRSVAIKFLHEQHSGDAGFVARFREEARAAASIKHPNVVEVLDYGRWDERYFLAMELVQGVSLREHLDKSGTLPVGESVEIMLQVCSAIEAAHQAGLVHGDLKPGNILIREDGTAKLADFGLARAASPGNVTMSAAALSTAQYMAPEVAQGRAPGTEADVYALGVILYELLTGRPPFSAYNAISVAMLHMNERPVAPRSINREIPASLEQIALKAMAKRPQQRYASATEMRAALDAASRRLLSPLSRLAMSAGVPVTRRGALAVPFVAIVLGIAALSLSAAALLLAANFGDGGLLAVDGPENPTPTSRAGGGVPIAGTAGAEPSTTPAPGETRTPGRTPTVAPSAISATEAPSGGGPTTAPATSTPVPATAVPATSTPAPPTAVPTIEPTAASGG